MINSYFCYDRPKKSYHTFSLHIVCLNLNMRRTLVRFTFVEFLVMIAIIGVLASLLQPSLARVSERSRQLVCASHIDQLHTAHYLYTDDHNGVRVTPTHYLTADGFRNWPNVPSIPERSLLILVATFQKA